MNASPRRRAAYARQLAVLRALRAAADTARATIAAAHPAASALPVCTEAVLAAQLSELLQRLDRVALAYCNYVTNLPQLGLFPPTDAGQPDI